MQEILGEVKGVAVAIIVISYLFLPILPDKAQVPAYV